MQPTARSRVPALAVAHSPTVRAHGPVMLLVPVGSVEQHGPHLPLGTDGVIAQAVTARVASVLSEEGATVSVAPAVAFGASGEHEEFDGTVSIGQDALSLLLLELGRSACRWADSVIFVNAHGGNAMPIVRAVARLRYEGRAVAWAPIAIPHADAHAGRSETSLMLCLQPDAVLMAQARPGVLTPVAQLMPQLRDGGLRAVTADGVLGDPTGATAQEGTQLLAQAVADVVERIRRPDVDDNGQLSSPSPLGVPG